MSTPPTTTTSSTPPNSTNLDRSHPLFTFLGGKSNIIILSGAGLSVSCGIPDFRSAGGLYNSLDLHALDLTCPEDLFDLDYFKDNAVPFYTFAKSLYSGVSVEPSPGHYWLNELQASGKLLRVYTQNIDMLEEKAGVLPSKIVYCHGNTQSVTCMRCKAVTSVVRDDEKIMARILSGKVPHCDAASEAPLATKKPKLERQSSRNSARQHDKNYLSSDRTSPPLSPSLCNGVLKPSITFFGEKPAYNLTRMLNLDKKACDGLIVVGTSLAVAPMSCVMKFLKDVPRCLINRDDVPIVEGGGEFEVKCFGNVDAVVDEDATFEATEGGEFLFEGATFDGSQQIDPLVQPLVGVSCDSCGQDIEPPEEVFVCVQCFCFDLCEGCLKGAQETHMDGKHTFVAEDHAS